MYEWDNDFAEDAKFADESLFFAINPLPKMLQLILANRSLFAFPNSTPAQDLWEVNSRVVSKVHPDLGFIGNFTLVMHRQMVVTDVIERLGGDIRIIYNKVKVTTTVKAIGAI
jgi:hypothetical protein